MTVITLPFSDGVPDGVPPTKLERPPTEANAQYDYNRLVQQDDPKYQRWLKTLGGHVQVALGRSGGDDAVLASLPENYTLIEHCKSADNTSQPRRDAYLYGHPSGSRFRSINEFVPHAIWLATSATRDKDECGCRFCSGAARSPAASRVGRGGGTPGSAARRKKAAAPSGQSSAALARIQQARQQMHDDLKPTAHVYRTGEVVLKGGVAHLVHACLPGDDAERPVSLSEALHKHRYRLVRLNDDEPARVEAMHHELQPYLSRPDTNFKTSSAIGLQTIRKGGTDPGGPVYLGWYLGPERIWLDDIVRMSPSASGADTNETFFHIALIYLDLDESVVRIRGDHIELVPRDDPSLDTGDARFVPDMIKVYAALKGKAARYSNPLGYDVEASLAEVQGRMYWPSAYSGRLYPVGQLQIARGRAATLRDLVDWPAQRLLELGLDDAPADVPSGAMADETPSKRQRQDGQ